MKKNENLWSQLNNRFFSSNYQLQRIVVLAGVVLVLAVVSFGAYYYYDRFYHVQAPAQEVNLAEAKQAVRDDPQNVDKRLTLAQSYMVSRSWTEAITQAEQIKATNPEELRADFVLGISYANNGDPQQAIEPLEKYIAAKKDESMAGLNKQYLAALYYLGDSYMQLGQPDKAVPPLEAAAQLSATDADAFYKLGLAYTGIKEYDRAVVVFQRAVAFVPDFTDAYTAMARAYEAAGKKSEASYAEGMVAYAQKDYAKAYPVLLQAAQDLPSFAPAFTGLGLTCEAQNNLQCALDAYKSAAAINPADFTASRGAERIAALMKK